MCHWFPLDNHMNYWQNLLLWRINSPHPTVFKYWASIGFISLHITNPSLFLTHASFKISYQCKAHPTHLPKWWPNPPPLSSHASINVMTQPTTPLIPRIYQCDDPTHHLCLRHLLMWSSSPPSHTSYQTFVILDIQTTNKFFGGPTQWYIHCLDQWRNPGTQWLTHCSVHWRPHTKHIDPYTGSCSIEVTQSKIDHCW